MNWYIAKLVYQIFVFEGEPAAQFEEQLRLVRAENKQDALDKAVAFGEQDEAVFYNYRDQQVYWKFVDVPELQPVHRLNDGLQLYSHLEQPEYADAYLELVQRKAERVRADKAYLV